MLLLPISSLFLLSQQLAMVSAHAALWHPSMFGFNVTDRTFAPRDNRPVAPLQDMTFNEWWFHGHLGYPPHPGDLFKLPAGGRATAEIACHKGATSYWATSEGSDIQQDQNPCPNSPLAAIHTRDRDDVKGCALAIAYKADVRSVQPEDFTVFSVNQVCVWTRFTDFYVPADMPPCPPGGCTCAWFWVHSEKSGSEQMYMNGFKCEVTGSRNGGKRLQKPQVARRCGADPQRGRMRAMPSNCTHGPKQPFYWFQKERNNMFEGEYSPPFYNDLYDFRDGAQNDIFVQDDAAPPESPPPSSSLPNPSTSITQTPSSTASPPPPPPPPSPPHNPYQSDEEHGAHPNGPGVPDPPASHTTKEPVQEDAAHTYAAAGRPATTTTAMVVVGAPQHHGLAQPPPPPPPPPACKQRPGSGKVLATLETKKDNDKDGCNGKNLCHAKAAHRRHLRQDRRHNDVSLLW